MGFTAGIKPVAEQYTESSPTGVSAPTISGMAQQGSTLSETHGSWSDAPTGYQYQWEDCDGSGAQCAAIAGATDQSYTLTDSDVDHTVRVQERATNAAGTSGPEISDPTAVVQSPPAPSNPPTTTTTTTTTTPTRPVIVAPGSAGAPATVLSVIRPGEACAPLSNSRACIPAPRSPAKIFVPARFGWHGSLQLRTSAGEPLAGASVQVIDGRRTLTVHTGPSGTASFTVPAGGDRTVRFVFAGSAAGRPSSASITVSSRAATTLRLVRVVIPGKIEFAGVAVNAAGSRARDRIAIQMLRSGRWVTVAAVYSARKNGWWNAEVARPSRGKHSFRTVVDGTPAMPLVVTVH